MTPRPGSNREPVPAGPARRRRAGNGTPACARPLLVVVLAPPPEVIAAREAGRTKTAYGQWTPTQLDGILRQETPPLGLWLDTAGQTPDGTVTEILARAWSDARIP